jgi:hypothetical protein
MKPNRITYCLAVLSLAPFASADTLYNISLNTAPLAGNGPFALDFQFLDGSGLPIDLNNNTVKLTAFAFGVGGSALGGGTANNGASGSLTTGITLNDSAFFNEYFENFTPGSVLSFQLDTTNAADPGGTPDLFTFAILDSSGDELPTTGPSSEFLDVSLGGGATPDVATFGSAPGSGFVLHAPVVQPESPVPEPPTIVPLLVAALGLGTLKWRRTLMRR